MIPHPTNFDDVRRGLSRVTTNGIEDISSTLSWRADSVNPDIGNGTLAAYLVRSLQWAHLTVRVTVGSTTTFGSGNWFFVPPVDCSFDTPSVSGTGWANDNSGGDYYVLVPTLLAVNQIYIVGVTGAFLTSLDPFSWATGDILNFSIFYPLAG